ncbi:MAG: MFS transporter [Promethearchaeota archaeon]
MSESKCDIEMENLSEIPNELNKSSNLQEEKKNFGGFITIFSSQYISLIGSQIVSFAVIWYLTITTESSLILSIASLCNIVPMIIVSPFAGVIADRISKNFILIASDAMQAFATFVLILLFYFGVAEMWHILVLLVIRGLMQGFQMPVSAVVTPLMVPEKHIKQINALDQILRSVLSISTPAIGALLISVYTIEQIYWLDVFTFIPSAIVLLLIKIPDAKNNKKAKASIESEIVIQGESNTEIKEKTSFKTEFKEGMAYIKKSGLLPAFIFFATANLIVVPTFSFLSLLIVDFHGGSVTQYGITEIMFHVGLVIGSIVLILSKRKATMKSVVLFGTLLSVALLLLGVVPRGVWWAFYTTCGLTGFILAFIDTQLMSVLQVTIPKDLQGRVFSTMFVIIKSVNPLGLIIWGALGEFMPISLIFILSPAISLVVYFILFKTTKMIHYGEN